MDEKLREKPEPDHYGRATMDDLIAAQKLLNEAARPTPAGLDAGIVRAYTHVALKRLLEMIS